MATDLTISAEELGKTVEALSEVFTARSTRHALIGGLATVLRGRLRYTQDVDFLVDVPQLALPDLLDGLVEQGFTLDPATVIRQYVREHVTSFTFGPVRIDWLKPILPVYARALTDAEPMEWSEGHPVRVATAEGLILTKMVAFRSQDQTNIETLLIANCDTIDINLIRGEWSIFAAEEAERTAWLEAVIERRVVRRE